jgi:hypothetical protein
MCWDEIQFLFHDICPFQCFRERLFSLLPSSTWECCIRKIQFLSNKGNKCKVAHDACHHAITSITSNYLDEWRFTIASNTFSRYILLSFSDRYYVWAYNGHTLEEKAKISNKSNIKSKHYCGSNSAVECQLPKLDVAGSIPVSRSSKMARE